MDKRFWAILIGLAIIIVGIIWLASPSKSNAPSGGSVSGATNHVEGQGQDGVKLVEYGDYECPYCGEYYPVVKQVVSTYNQQITFQFRNLPLTQIHPNAFAGARAAEAAAMQGQFWQMHDMLYQNQNAWVNSSDPEPIFVQYAQSLGLNVNTFKQDYASTAVNNAINADVAAFNKTGAQEATPSFFLDGQSIQPAPTLASFESLINAEIKKKGFTPPAGTSSSAPSTGNSTTQSKQ